MTLDYFYGQSGELFSYFRIPKALFHDCRFRQLSTDARTLYGILLDRMSLSVKNGWLDEQGRVYIIYTVREVQESLCCAEHKAVNKTEWNDPDPIYSGGIREQLEYYFCQALEIDLLLRLCPDEEDTIYQIVDLLVDTCSTKRKMLRIAGDDKPVEVVRSRLKKLNADHIRFVLRCLAENSSPIRNMKQYLLASLYNAPTTMQLSYQNQTNHDLAIRR